MMPHWGCAETIARNEGAGRDTDMWRTAHMTHAFVASDDLDFGSAVEGGACVARNEETLDMACGWPKGAHR